MNEKIKAIYEKIANKELSFGCNFFYKNEWDNEILTFCKIYEDTGNTYTLSFLIPSKERTDNIHSLNELKINELEIIGHPIMIGDVLDYIDFTTNRVDLLGVPFEWKEILNLWKHKKTSIEAQSEECIDYIYNLIK